MSLKLQGYEVLNTLGSTKQGIIRKARQKEDGKILIWKEIDVVWMSKVQRKSLVTEINLLKELKHKNVVQYYNVITDTQSCILYILMEFCKTNLSQLIIHCKSEGIHLEEDLIWRMLYQMTQGLLECHNRNKKNGENHMKSIFHRNIKATNVFLDEWNNIKIGDFGFELLLSHSHKLSGHTASPYISPEQMNNLSYNEKSDVWAMGCLVYELCAFAPPFYGSNQAELAMSLRSGNFKRIPSKYSNELQNIVSAMLTVEDILRPTIDLINQHPKLVAINQQKLDKEWENRTFSFVNTPNQGKDCSAALKVRLEAVKRREQAVCAKELLLGERLRDQEKREKKLILKERLVEERLARAEVYLKQHKLKTSASSSDNTRSTKSSNHDLFNIPSKNSEFSQSAEKIQLIHNEQKNFSSMKHVHFDARLVVDKENIPLFTKYKFVKSNASEKWIDGPKIPQKEKDIDKISKSSKLGKAIIWKRI